MGKNTYSTSDGEVKGPGSSDLKPGKTSSILDNNNLLSEWLISYLTPLLMLGANKVLTEEDIGPTCKQDDAERIYKIIRKNWDNEKLKAIRENEKRHEKAKLLANKKDSSGANVTFVKKKPSLAKAFLRSAGIQKFIAFSLYYLVSVFLQFIPVLILNDLVTYFENFGESRLMFGMNPWVEVALLILAPILTSLLQNRHSVIAVHLGIFLRTCCSTLLYEKSLCISPTGRSKTNVGQVVNMMSNDTSQMQRFIQFSGFFFSAPIQIILALYLIFQQVGNAMWVGVAYMILLAPVNMIMFSVIGKLRREVLKHSDNRVKVMNEILNGIRIIKFYAWEVAFGKEVGKVRRLELIALTKMTYVSSIGFSVILLSAPVIQPILVFLTYISIQDEPLNPATAFTTIALFNVMRFPFAFLPMGFLQYIQGKIALKRITRYLNLPELEKSVCAEAPPDAALGSPSTQEGSITIKNGTFGWVNPEVEVEPLPAARRKGKDKTKNNSEKEDTDKELQTSDEKRISILDDISFNIEAGQLVAIVGEVGCGKSSLLSAILGEMEPINGSKVYIPQQKENANFTAYCNQTPWVVNDTLKGNILFGRDFDEKRYDKVVKACALLDDLAILPAGDMTEIGERGINLSGGQKARVCLARAMYSAETKILLLDDPLSAVDAHVGDHLFTKAIKGEISRGTTRILVTHHVHFLPRCDYVIVMEDGKIAHQGKYNDLILKGVEFKGAIESSSASVEGDDAESRSKASKSRALSRRGSSMSGDNTQKEAMKKKGANLITDEDREEGEVDSSAYTKYARAGGIMNALLVIFFQILNRGLDIGGSFWLAYWSSQTILGVRNGNPFTDEKTLDYVGIFAAFGGGSVIALAFRGLLLAQHRLKASRSLHDGITDSILRAPVSFFDVTPTGRVLNRFAYDMDKVDLELTNTISQLLSTLFSVIGAIGAILASTKGIFIIPLIPLTFLYYYVQKWFRKSSTELQRVTSMTGSPIFSDFSQTLSGVSTVRAFGMETRFFNNCKSSFNKNNASYILVQLAGLWLGLRLDIMGGVISGFIGALSVGTANYNFIPAAWLGLALSISIEITGSLKHGARMMASVEADLTSVERILSYTNGIEQEPPSYVPDEDPKEGTWPSKGEIDVEHISMRYRDGPLVLKNLSFNIDAGEKIGVVGRTGSGKSSFMIALFRITGLEPDDGKICIDGVNISKIGTSVLRSNLSIIPQDPVLFSNTVRYNLDPFGNVDDEEIWSTLRKVNLANFVSNLDNGLEELVAEGGENFSQGQRQLLCIARSILRKPKILIMDEATASIDNTTDALVQDMIRENFSNATVLTIAHRLNTIMDSDRVLVLDNGRVAEFDTPTNLLENSTSIFYGMVQKSRTSKGNDDGINIDES